MLLFFFFFGWGFVVVFVVVFILSYVRKLAGYFQCRYRLVGIVVKVSASRAEDPGFESHFRGDFASHTSDKKTGTPGDTLPGAWHYRVSAGTGWPCVISPTVC